MSATAARNTNYSRAAYSVRNADTKYCNVYNVTCARLYSVFWTSKQEHAGTAESSRTFPKLSSVASAAVQPAIAGSNMLTCGRHCKDGGSVFCDPVWYRIQNIAVTIWKQKQNTYEYSVQNTALALARPKRNRKGLDVASPRNPASAPPQDLHGVGRRRGALSGNDRPETRPLTLKGAVQDASGPGASLLFLFISLRGKPCPQTLFATETKESRRGLR